MRRWDAIDGEPDKYLFHYVNGYVGSCDASPVSPVKVGPEREPESRTLFHDCAPRWNRAASAVIMYLFIKRFPGATKSSLFSKPKRR